MTKKQTKKQTTPLTNKAFLDSKDPNAREILLTNSQTAYPKDRIHTTKKEG